MRRSARRQIVRARCSDAATGLPPARMNRRSGGNSLSKRSITSSSRCASASVIARLRHAAGDLVAGIGEHRADGVQVPLQRLRAGPRPLHRRSARAPGRARRSPRRPRRRHRRARRPWTRACRRRVRFRPGRRFSCRSSRVDYRKLRLRRWRVTRTSTTRSSCCPRRSAARSSPSGTSAGRSTMRWTSPPRTPPDAIARALAFWRAEVDRMFGGEPPVSEQGRAVQPLVAEFRLPRQPFDDLIDGVAMDVGAPRYATFDDLRGYCYRVASTVGLVCVAIFGGHSEQARRYAVELGLALQLTNILRDVPDGPGARPPVHPARRTAAIRVQRGRPAPGAASSNVRDLLAHQASRARESLRPRRAALPRDERRQLAAAEIMGAIYDGILDPHRAPAATTCSPRSCVCRGRDAWPSPPSPGCGCRPGSATRRPAGDDPGSTGSRRRRRRRVGACRRGAPCRRGRAGAAARGAWRPRRPGDVVHRQPDRRGVRQRPARADGLLPGDLRVPRRDGLAPSRRGVVHARASPAWTKRAASRCCGVRPGRRR